MKTILFILLQFLAFHLSAQIEISGTIFSENNEPVTGANIFIQGSYNGTTSDSLGYFSFGTDLTGDQTLIASFIGYKTQAVQLHISKNIQNLKIILQDDVSELNEVVINAGTFEASDKKKSVLLKPLDIALTAGANGDVFGAFGTLPGTQKVGEEGRLFVRGGDAYETKTFMDGMLVNSPYYSQMPDLPTQGRFSPLLFNGSVFSTGGYSAEFGQALSSIVALNTTALEPETKSNISVLTVGLQGSHAHRWDNTSLAITGELLHTGLSNRLFPQNIDWIKEPIISGSTLLFRHKTSETGMIKSFGSFNYNTSTLLYDNFEESKFQNLALTNNNVYLNTTYNEMLGEKWMVNTGVSVNTDNDKIVLENEPINTLKKSGQVKTVFTNFTTEKITTKFGADWVGYDYLQKVNIGGNYKFGFTNQQLSSFVESEIKINHILAVRAGLRAEYSSLIQQSNWMPRLSAAIKTGKNSQLSTAFGKFCQNPEEDYLKFNDNLQPEKSTHSILTWQYKKGTKSFRFEAYYKKYSDLIKYDEENSAAPENYNNSGSGYSHGIDVFWRNRKEFGKSDYWISYSWIDTKRNYLDFPVEATPYFVSAHNLSLVYKRFFTGIQSFASVTYSFASGRPYYNPNNPKFMSDRTRCYNDISIGLTHLMYLFNTQTVLHLIVNNMFGFNNIFGYTYSNTPDETGIYPRQAVTPATKRMAVFLISFQF
ncbi:TonB-dependent receptor [Maribellus comscasis]|uniref:TonB-dependent receptor n=1 Tax=Maribellus comscasis TaxID=2681766 RepID=A0A6I6JHV2_9BACT|nr:TonB-dependent receptor [Maribellus comscasis]QGY42455.1 TonB-dependent receptor [Maribellus comscasis]